MSTQETLMDMYQALRAHFGHQNWWPGETPLEIALGAILTQNTNWRNVERAIDHLKAAGCLDVGRLAEMHHAPLAELIRPAGYYNVKARRLMSFIAHVHGGWGDNLEAFLDRPADTLRRELMGIKGIGAETADSIVLYAAGKLTFVVDAYTCRVLHRHRLIAPEDDYEAVKATLESALPAELDLYNDFHAQFVAVGKHFCKKRSPKCPSCPLNHLPHDIDEPWL
jgi:endonuclease-3 related protein